PASPRRGRGRAHDARRARRGRGSTARGPSLSRDARLMSARTILVTGFEPFTPHKINPTEELARALDGFRVRDTLVHGAVLPVHHADAAPRVQALLAERRPFAVLHLGLAA